MVPIRSNECRSEYRRGIHRGAGEDIQHDWKTVCTHYTAPFRAIKCAKQPTHTKLGGVNSIDCVKLAFTIVFAKKVNVVMRAVRCS